MAREAPVGGKRTVIVAAAVVAAVLAVIAAVYAHKSVKQAAGRPAQQSSPAAPVAPPPSGPGGDGDGSGSPSPSSSTPYQEAPENTPAPPPMWGTSTRQQNEILARTSDTALNWASSLFSRFWQDKETGYITNTAQYQAPGLTQQETQFEATITGQTDWRQLHDQQCTVTVTSPIAVPPDNYTANYPGPHVPTLASQWVVLSFTTIATCKHPSPSLPPVPSVNYQRLVQLAPAKAGNPDGAWIVTGAYSSWDSTSQSGSVFGDAGGPSPQGS